MAGKAVRENKKNILGVGWIGHRDFGDEAMAFVIRTVLKKQLAAESITYYKHGKYPCFKGGDDLKISFCHRETVYSWNWKRKLLDSFNLKKFDTLLCGGGSILHSFNSISWKLGLLRKIKRIHGARCFSALLGVSIGPLVSERAKRLCGEFLDELDFIVTRDEYSANAASGLSNNKNICSSLDLSLLLPYCSPEEMPKASLGREDDLVGIMFIEKKGQKKLYEKAGQIDKYIRIVDFILEKNRRVMLMTLYSGDEYIDRELNNCIKRKAKFPERVSIHTFDGNIFSTIKEINRCSSIVSMRYHGIVLSYLLGIPFVSLGYDRKNRSFCESIGYKSDLVFDALPIGDIDRIMSAVDKVLGVGEGVFKNTIHQTNAINNVYKNVGGFIEYVKHRH